MRGRSKIEQDNTGLPEFDSPQPTEPSPKPMTTEDWDTVTAVCNAITMANVLTVVSNF